MSNEKVNPDISKLMLKVAQDLRSLADSVQAVYEAMQEDLPDKQPTAIEEKPAVEEKPSISLEQVRSVLAEKSQAGHTAEVRAIIGKYGASRLSEIDAKDYAAVLKDAEELC